MRLRKKVICILLLFLAMILGSANPVLSENLAFNGDFNLMGEDGMPEGWETGIYGNAKVNVSREQIGSEYVVKVEVVDPGVDSKVYLVGRVTDAVQPLPGDWRDPITYACTLLHVAVKAKVEGGNGFVRALWGTYSLNDARRTAPLSPEDWTTVEGVRKVIDYRYAPRYCAVACYPTTKGEIFSFSDFRLEKTTSSAPISVVEMNWPEITDEEAKAVPSVPGNIIYDSGFNSFSPVWWWFSTWIWNNSGINDSRCARNNCRSDYFHLEPGRAYTVSACLRADNPTEAEINVWHARKKGEPLLSNDPSGEKSYGFKKHVSVGTQWTRYHGSFIAGYQPEQLDLDSYELIIQGSDIYIDNVQIEQGPFREYQPRPAEGYVSITRKSDTYLTLFYPEEPIEINCRLVVNTKVPQWVDFVVVDYYGREVERRRKILTIQLGGEENWKESINLHRPGVYRVMLDAPELEQPAPHCPGTRSMGLAIANPLWEGANPIMCMSFIHDGCNFPREMQMRVARMLGVHFARFFVGWNRIEEERDVFTFNAPIDGTLGYDDMINQAIDAGITPWITVDNILGHPDPTVNSGPSWLNFPHYYDYYEMMNPIDPIFLERYRIYVGELVNHFKDRVRYFECMNEAFMGFYPRQYMDFLNMFYNTAKTVDPNLKVIAGPAAYLDWNFAHGVSGWLYDAVVYAGFGNNNIDILSCHDYDIPDHDELTPWSAVTKPEIYDELKALIPQIGTKNIPLWLNEYGHRSAEWTLLTPPTDYWNREFYGFESDFNEGVNWAVKTVVIDYYNGVRMFGPIGLLSGTDNPRTAGPLWGISFDGVLKPDTVAFAQACYRFRDAEPANWFKVMEDGSAYFFNTGAGAMVVLFTIPHKGLEYSWQNVPNGLIVENIYGADYPWTNKQGESLKLKVGAEPVFLLLPGGTAENLSQWVTSAEVKKIPVRHNREFSGKLVPLTEHFPFYSAIDEVGGLSIVKSGQDLSLTWDAVVTDTNGDPLEYNIDHYEIYRGTSPDFIPDLVNKTNLIGTSITTSFTDTGAVASADSYYYYIVAVDSAGNQSSIDHANPDVSQAFKRILNLHYQQDNINMYWISLPYDTHYINASDLGNDLGAGNPCTQISRWDPDTQSFVDCTWTGVAWVGDFPLIPGESIRVRINDNVTNKVIIGTNARPDPQNMTYHPNKTNLRWISLPVDTTYAKASDLGNDIGSACTQVSRWNEERQEYEDLVWIPLLGKWAGKDFGISSKEGYLVIIKMDVTGWQVK